MITAKEAREKTEKKRQVFRENISVLVNEYIDKEVELTILNAIEEGKSCCSVYIENKFNTDYEREIFVSKFTEILKKAGYVVEEKELFRYFIDWSRENFSFR